jgi:hypothetical protein
VVRVTIKASTKCYWEIWENSEVYYKAHIGSQIDYRKSFFTIKIKREGKEEQCSESGFQEQIISESGKEVTLGAGCYEVWVHLCQAREQDFTLSYYGEEDVQLVRVKNKEKWPS